MIDRRQFLKLAGAFGTQLTIQSLSWAQNGPVRIRQSLNAPSAQSDVMALSDAVKKMKANSNAMDPLSWMYWANVHGMTSSDKPAELDDIWDTCDHGQYFLAWHRMYLIFFERVVANLSGKNDFSLPYWDWYASLNIPGQFLSPADPSNSLWQNERGYNTRFTVSTDVLQNPSTNSYSGFNRLSFGNPHSNIHLNFSGEMSNPATAGRDPIFWPHHASMDRLWEIWLTGNGHRNPGQTDTWAKKDFSFVNDSSGKNIPVSKMLTADQLNYRYDSLIVSGQENDAPPRPKLTESATKLPVSETAINSNSVLALAERINLTLDGSSKTVRFPLPVQSSAKLESVGNETTNASGLTLMLEGLEITEEGKKENFVYEIYINLPHSSPNKAAGEGILPYRIGQIDSFFLRSQHKHQGHDLAIPIELDPVVPALRLKGAWSPDQIEINFVSKDPALKPIGQVKIKSARIEIGPKNR